MKYIITYLVITFSTLIAQTTFTVTNTNNTGEGSLAKAISDANINTGTDIIEFNISGIGPHKINLSLGLPEITDPVSILGYSQSGSSKATSNSKAVIMIELDGTSSGQDATGLSIKTDNCVIQGLAITNFGRDGIYISGTNNKVQGNIIGLSTDGNTAKGNGYRSSDNYAYEGIWIDNSPNNLIGGTNPEDRNIISCNAYTNIFIGGISSTNNKIQGNIIGTNADGTSKIDNYCDGIFLYSGSSNTLIGGIESYAGNLISGNNYFGIYCDKGSNSNTIQGNLIGTDITGTLPLGNGEIGIAIHGASNNLIGGSKEGSENVISGNGFIYSQGGIGIDENSEGNIIKRNFIGTDLTGTIAIPNNEYGIMFYNSNNNSVGGEILNEGNIISGNKKNGILLDYSSGNSIRGNIIGLDASGIKKLANQSSGILLYGSSSNIIGSNIYSERNIISGNERDGIRIWTKESMENRIIGNVIGLSIDEKESISNTQNGIGIFGGSSNIIGGINSEERNLIAGNGENGILIKNVSQSSNKIAYKSDIQNGFQSMNLKRKTNGIKNYLNKNDNNNINDLTKIVAVNDSGNFNSILGNSIYANTILGIDLFDISRSNDDQDSDKGSNGGQNYPEINSVTGDGTVATIQYSVNSSTSNSVYPLRIEFFLADEKGQGKIFLGYDMYAEPDAIKNKSFSFSPSINIGESENIVATATDVNGNTSEFSDPYTTLGIVEVEDKNVLPKNFNLLQNYPNPFNPTTTINYELPKDGHLILNVCDALGRQIAILENGYKKAGNYVTSFDASNLTSGIYFYTINAGSFTDTKKMLLIK